jgi:hypothetical protein
MKYRRMQAAQSQLGVSVTPNQTSPHFFKKNISKLTAFTFLLTLLLVVHLFKIQTFSTYLTDF